MTEVIKRCKQGNHELVMIYSFYEHGEDDAGIVVRWCKVCGAVVVDEDYDGRTKPGAYMRMKLPSVTEEYVKLLRIAEAVERYLEVKKSWDNRLRELVELKQALASWKR